MSVSKTPQDVSIRPRHPVFDLHDTLATDWHSDDPFKTAFFNALSLTFPVGEKYFIDSVRAFQKEVTDPKLTREIRGFIGQEAIHRREHASYNEILCRVRGYAGASFEAGLQRRIDERSQQSAYVRLLETVAFEHLTAILAHGLLTDERWLDGAQPVLKAMWRWHAIEEAEHKAVTFDVYRAVGGNMEWLKQALPLVTRQMFKDLLSGTWMMLKANGQHLNPVNWMRGLNWLFGTGGVARRLAPLWHDFKRDDFHPWDHDNRALIEAWRANDEPVLLAA
jgi:predicted metal-dependent hydrolase